ncbi:MULTISPECIES: DUF397 domain-containing protein [Streptomyces]|uniref:DUF397 domain-containing protein n=1 Tax=Streptomyces cyaneofuscatus TaxID=66883 RepID=A0ABZ1EV93_9ACTN|nr:DUF397 domain-containing protein [Streptomyces cyaneofuscatus]WSB07894.1 DUF397 domain-containing protein [Streptomyces cyaneofuscatus]WSD48573.1 DUF397 domain-containing protein [Streptomyces cyaneofuscatus]WTA91982.1 DUF397 domain-containing protein [Streptomyces cyaneofuscatus]
MDHGIGHWFKSSYSGGSGTECVEVAALATAVGVRDSTRPQGPHISVGRTAWAGFVAGVADHG